MIPRAYRMHVQREFLISSAASDPEVHWAGQTYAAASTKIEAIAPSRRAARGQQKRPPMKLSRTVGLAVAVSLVAGTVAALAQISGAAPASPTANVRQAAYAQGAEHGKTIFKACAACHATDHANRFGPALGGLIGRKAGTVPGFRYSDAMKKSGIVWDAKTLDAYLESPQKVVPGNRMPYAGLKNPTDRTDLVGYLATLK